MNIEQYLNRINYTGRLDPTLEVLNELQKAHVLHIPFENLDIHLGVPIDLDIDKLFHKIVINQRGGLCYELNSLFLELLTDLGFNAKRISGRVYDKNKGYGEEFDHLAIIVNLNGLNYLSDVGLGEFTFAALKLESETLQNDQRGNFLVEHYKDNYYRVSKVEKDQLLPEYIFKILERQLSDFNEMCYYHQTNSKSFFTQKRLITKPTQHGRITISGNKLIMKSDHVINEITLDNEESFQKELIAHFNTLII